MGCRALSAAEYACGGMSNAPDAGPDPEDAAVWPKVALGASALEQVLRDVPPGASEDVLAERLFELLA